MPLRRLLKLSPAKAVLEWEVGEESDAPSTIWVPRATHLHALQRYRWSLQRLALVATLLLLAGIIAVAHLVNRAEHKIAQTEREIELVTEADLWMANAERSRLTESVQRVSSPAIVYSGQWKSQIQAIELHNDLAIVRVLVDDAKLASVAANHAGAPGAEPAGYETWFYRQSQSGWKHIAADATLWGPSRTKESAHFLFQYHQLDHGAVETVMPAIEAFKSDLYRNLGIDLPPDPQKVTIRIAIVGGHQFIDPFILSSSNDSLVVLSPHGSLRVPASMSDADLLRQSIQTALAYQIINLALQQVKPQAAWQPLIDGLRQWAYLAHHDLHVALADELNTALKSALRQRLALTTPPRLPLLSAPALIDPEETEVMRWKRNVVAKTVIDYAIATYGHASLARLLTGLRQYDTWQSLIPHVFGVSVNEFESGWQAYLATEYDLLY